MATPNPPLSSQWVGRDGCGRCIPGDRMSPPHTLPPGEARGLKGGGGEAKFAESPPFPSGMEPLAVKHGGVLSPGRPGCGEGRGSSEDT